MKTDTLSLQSTSFTDGASLDPKFAMKAVTGISALAIGGTALLIVVSVVLDLVKKVDAQISMREY